MKWFENVVQVCMGIQPEERVLLITDQTLSAEQDLLAEAIEAVGPAELFRWTLPEDERPLTVAPPDILEKLRTYDVCIHFLGYTSAPEQPYRMSMLKAVQEGDSVRLASGLGINQAIIENELTADYEKVAAITGKLRQELQERDQVHITSPLGTDLTFSIKGRKVAADPGMFREPGFYNLPSGECYVAPIETSANGIWVVDKSFPGIIIEEPIRITFEDGRATKIEGGKEAKELSNILEEAKQKPNGENARIIAELGIGTNPEARITGSVMTDEKVMGTIHIAIGHNAVAPYNGENVAPIHLDGVMSQPTLTVDGKTLIEDGSYLV